MSFRCAIGQDSHRFDNDITDKPLILGGVEIDAPDAKPLLANSDGDVVLHALTNAVSGITCRNILGTIADRMCKSGITDSSGYLEAALKDLSDMGFVIENISFSIEALKPHFSKHIPEMRKKIGEICNISPDVIGITATSGEGLTDFGRGLGIQVFCIITVSDKNK